jgi:hypothetical protein
VHPQLSTGFELTTSGRQSAIIKASSPTNFFDIGFRDSFLSDRRTLLSRQADDSDGPSTLPIAELNPLLNPVLGQNMGRWAEVYFTTPPERRQQAVLDLLRELQREGAAPLAAVASSSPQLPEQVSDLIVPPATAIPEEPATPIHCAACGWENPAAHRFCGMCGERVGGEEAEGQRDASELRGTELSQQRSLDDRGIGDQVEGRPIEERHIIEDRSSDRRPSEERPQDETAAWVTGNLPSAELQLERPAEAVYEPALSTNDLSLFQNRFAADEEDFREKAASRSYIFYVGIALAVAILALAYIAWRGAQATTRTAQAKPQAPAAVTTQPAAAASAGSKASLPASLPATTNAAPGEPLSASPAPAGREAFDDAQPASQQAADLSSEVSANEGTGARAFGERPSKGATRATATSEKSQVAETAAGNGGEELALAQRYLNGANGEPRNSAEAAKWLWKAMAKHNATATLLLADLYLKGDGVAKNCDQARVLLDSAALRGVKDAGERLRHLQAFGCD